MGGSRVREEAGRRLLPQWSAGNSPGAERRAFFSQLRPLDLQPHARCSKALLDRRGAASGAEAQPHPLWPSLDTGMLRVGPPEETPLRKVPGRQGLGEELLRGTDAIPSPLGRARGPEPLFEA